MYCANLVNTKGYNLAQSVIRMCTSGPPGLLLCSPPRPSIPQVLLGQTTARLDESTVTTKHELLRIGCRYVQYVFYMIVYIPVGPKLTRSFNFFYDWHKACRIATLFHSTKERSNHLFVLLAYFNIVPVSPFAGKEYSTVCMEVTIVSGGRGITYQFETALCISTQSM